MKSYNGSSGSVVDFLLARLRTRKPININFLDQYQPPDIPDECDGRKAVRRNGSYESVPRDWNKRELKLKSRFPGVLLSYKAREQIKYVVLGQDAKLYDYIFALLDTAWSHWSREIVARQTTRKFSAWIKDYLLREDWFERLMLSRTLYNEAAQILRLSLGLPRFRRQ